jgi:hypothetical protein
VEAGGVLKDVRYTIEKEFVAAAPLLEPLGAGVIETGSTFSEYVLEQRLARAYRMLSAARFSGLAIGAIALEVGFSNLSYFNRTFRRRYGGSPSEIRGRAHAAD